MNLDVVGFRVHGCRVQVGEPQGSGWGAFGLTIEGS